MDDPAPESTPIGEDAPEPEPDMAPEPTPIRREPPVESGEAPDGQFTQILPAEPEDVQAIEPMKGVTADLTGPQLAEIRRRNDDVDKAQAEAQRAYETWQRTARLAVYAQSDLTGYLSKLQSAYDLDTRLNYRIDLEQGRIIPVQQG